MPLCVVAHGFGCTLAVDFFAHLQFSGRNTFDTSCDTSALTPLERGETLASLCTLGSPIPLLLPGSHNEYASEEVPLYAAKQMQVPALPVLKKWPHLRGGWTDFHHRGDSLSHALQSTYPAVTTQVECKLRRLKDKDKDKADLHIHDIYFSDLINVVARIAQSASWVWQDTNRTATRRRADTST